MYSLSPGSNYQPEKKLLVLRSLKRLSMHVSPLQLPSRWSPSSRYRRSPQPGKGPPSSSRNLPRERGASLHLPKALPHSVTSP